MGSFEEANIPSEKKVQIKSKSYDPFETLERINDNAYRVERPGEYDISTAFNVVDLNPHLEDEPFEDLRSNPLQQGEDDRDPFIESDPS